MTMRMPSRSALSSVVGIGAVLEGLGLEVRAQALDDVLDVTVHDARQVVLREADAVIGDAVLREVVGADLLGAVARADLRAPRLALGRRALLLLDVVEPRAQQLHGRRAVLVLRLLLLAVDDEAR